MQQRTNGLLFSASQSPTNAALIFTEPHKNQEKMQARRKVIANHDGIGRRTSSRNMRRGYPTLPTFVLVRDPRQYPISANFQDPSDNIWQAGHAWAASEAKSDTTDGTCITAAPAPTLTLLSAKRSSHLTFLGHSPSAFTSGGEIRGNPAGVHAARGTDASLVIRSVQYRDTHAQVRRLPHSFRAPNRQVSRPDAAGIAASKSRLRIGGCGAPLSGESHAGHLRSAGERSAQWCLGLSVAQYTTLRGSYSRTHGKDSVVADVWAGLRRGRGGAARRRIDAAPRVLGIRGREAASARELEVPAQCGAPEDRGGFGCGP
ncbi:hypothetical protein DFH09DRAFT_1104518 [Mycena vulgaris]|nr:hypothetical protein DFH09DRAFT_1104518 [Mycena vulgaris]